MTSRTTRRPRAGGSRRRGPSEGDAGAPPSRPAPGAWPERARDGEEQVLSSVDAPGAPGDEPGDPEAVARAICLRALTGAAKTRQQLADLLAKRGVPDEAAAAVLDRFTEVGLIDDAAFARAWVSSRQAGRGLARRALGAELRAKGVAPEVAAEALEEIDPQDEWDAARRLVARRLPSMQRLDRQTAERRLIGMLARKGYGGGLAAYVVREALDERGAEDDADASHPDLGLDAFLP
ncbi:regulatory protein RecX [Blastococcus sp. SYSU D00669]